MHYKKHTFDIEYLAVFRSTAPNNQIRIWFAQPQNSEYQRIIKFNSSLSPKSIYFDKQGNKILYFAAINSTNLTLKINLRVELTKHKTNVIALPKNLQTKKWLYLKSSKFIEQTPSIKQLTRRLTKNAKTDLQKLRIIFDFVVNNFKYSYPVKKRGVKNLDLNNLCGDCGEYSSLFVTMCRIAELPASNQTGFVIFEKQKTITEHGWASVYMSPYGWVDFDTQYASLEKTKNSRMQKYFGHRPEYRITFMNGLNAPIKPSIPRHFKIDFWKSLGLPVTQSSAQVLQPLIFASTHPVKFTDSIKLK